MATPNKFSPDWAKWLKILQAFLDAFGQQAMSGTNTPNPHHAALLDLQADMKRKEAAGEECPPCPY